MASKQGIPLPKQTFLDGLVKTAVDASCKVATDELLKAGKTVSENDRRVVVAQICDMVNFTTDAYLKNRVDEKVNPVDIGIYLLNKHVNLLRLTQQQQVLCATAVLKLGTTGYSAGKEYWTTVKEVRTASTIGWIGGPEMAAAFGTITLVSHGPDIYRKSQSFMNAALDTYKQCGPLVMDKVVKEPSLEPATPTDHPMCEAPPEQPPVQAPPLG